MFVFGIALLRLNELAEIIEGQMLLVPALSLQKLDSLIFNISRNYLFDKKVTTFLCQLDSRAFFFGLKQKIKKLVIMLIYSRSAAVWIINTSTRLEYFTMFQLRSPTLTLCGEPIMLCHTLIKVAPKYFRSLNHEHSSIKSKKTNKSR